MKADAYTCFLSKHKVTAYPTEKSVSPFKIASRTIRSVTPLLIASILSSSCVYSNAEPDFTPQSDSRKAFVESARARISSLKDSTMLADIETTALYQDVVNTYNIVPLQKKERLSEEDVLAIMANPNPPELKDYNFNHSPASNENFWEIVLNGVQKTQEIQDSEFLTEKEKKEYKITAFKMLSQITRAQAGDKQVDLTDYNNLKAFLYFEKVIEFEDNYEEVLGKSQGKIDERAEIFGRYYQDNLSLHKKAEKMPGVKKFAEALYLSDMQFIFNQKDSVEANKASMKILEDWMQTQQIKDKDLWGYTTIEENSSANVTGFTFRRGKKLQARLLIDPTGDLGEGFYYPTGVLLMHELQHVAQGELTSGETAADNEKSADEISTNSKLIDDDYISELGPTLYSLTMSDKINKELKGIDKDEVIDYGQLETRDGKMVSVGEIAVWFRHMTEKYPEKSIDKLIETPEVLNKINSWGTGHTKVLDQIKTVRE